MGFILFLISLVSLGETLLRFIEIDGINEWFNDAYTPYGIYPDGFAPSSSKSMLRRMKQTRRKPFLTEPIRSVDEICSKISKRRSKLEKWV